MKHITPEMAEALFSLLEVIDSNTDKYPDWIDAVCTAREKLPASTLEALKSAYPAPDQPSAPEAAGKKRKKAS